MPHKVKPARSYTANSQPLVSDLQENEMAVNWTDGRIYVRRNGAIVSHAFGGGGGSPYTLPTASASVLGGIKIGTGLSIDGNGVVTASGGGSASIVYAATAAGFPATGTTANLYCATDVQRVYRWDSTNSVYVELGSGV